MTAGGGSHQVEPVSGASIDRRALVDRHRVVMRGIDPRSPLSVGNGGFCFTADITGLQSLSDCYPIAPRDPQTSNGTLLGTFTEWGWHSEPGGECYNLDDSRVWYQSRHGAVPYVDMGGSISGGTERGTPDNELWLRSNPHRLHLGLIGFAPLGENGGADPQSLTASDITEPHQILDLWTGRLESSFRWRNQPVSVATLCDPERSQLVLSIRSRSLRNALGVRLLFPYGNGAWHNAADWTNPTRHETQLAQTGPDSWTIYRHLDDAAYQVSLQAHEDADVQMLSAHAIMVAASTDRLDLVVSFSPGAGSSYPNRSFASAAAADTARSVRRRTEEQWAGFWESGGAIDLSDVRDERGTELERRIVLSQYLTAINCAGSMPPAETGLVCNSWRGKFHLEMYWWHAAHFALWNRPALLRRSLNWYQHCLPSARETAHRQGFRGARWPKQVGPDGRETPSTIGPFLIWQQPHPIYLAELIYRATPERQVLEEFAEIVFQTADFMAGYAVATDRGYELGPPLVPAQESYGGMLDEVINPAYELVYWHWALQVANNWRQRLGLPRNASWRAVSAGIVSPTVRDRTYAAIGTQPWTIRTDHPSLLCALGVLPKTSRVDETIMSDTLDSVLTEWDWETTWGWDYPTIAMCATRLGRPETAVDALLREDHKNTALPNGHNRQSGSLPVYLPGNGGLLATTALMARGWDDGPVRTNPGFPADWPVRAEGLIPAP